MSIDQSMTKSAPLVGRSDSTEARADAANSLQGLRRPRKTNSSRPRAPQVARNPATEWWSADRKAASADMTTRFCVDSADGAFGAIIAAGIISRVYVKQQLPPEVERLAPQ